MLMNQKQIGELVWKSEIDTSKAHVFYQTYLRLGNTFLQSHRIVILSHGNRQRIAELTQVFSVVCS